MRFMKIIQNEKQMRDSNMELLRIFAMIMIILYHYVYSCMSMN